MSKQQNQGQRTRGGQSSGFLLKKPVLWSVSAVLYVTGVAFLLLLNGHVFYKWRVRTDFNGFQPSCMVAGHRNVTGTCVFYVYAAIVRSKHNVHCSDVALMVSRAKAL